METLALPGISLPHSKLVLGTMTFGDTADLETATRMVDVALEAGITSIDTANGYAKTKSESMLAEILRGRRDRIILATKAGIYPGDSGDNSLLSKAGITSSLNASLQRLGTDYVDIFYLHQPDRSAPLAETFGVLADLVSEGKIRAIGVSNYSAWQIGDVFAAADAAGAPRPVLAQQLYNLVARRIEAEYVEFSIQHNIGTIVYNPLGGGLLSGKHSFGDAPTEGRFGSSGLSAMYRDRYWNAQLFEAVDALATIAANAGVTLPELSLRWLLAKPVVSAILLGGSKVSQLEANIASAAAGPLEDDVVALCDEVGRVLAGPMPAYNR